MSLHRHSRTKRGALFVIAAALGLGAVLVPAEGHAAEGNAAPTVIPALKTWDGGDGNFTLTASARIVADAQLTDVAQRLATDLQETAGVELEIVAGSPRAGDVVLDLDDGLSNAAGGDRFDEEGYELLVTDRVEISAPSSTGVFYGTRSVLQILAGSDSRVTLPQGESADWPDSEVRGFMLDVGRRFFTADFVRDYISMMSWYKLNNFQIHLNDNQIGKPATGWQDGYAGFRLKSDNPDYAGLASADGAYTRADWQGFEDVAADHHVQIIPEIDVPAHSLAFIQWKPELGLHDGDSDHLDLTKPETTEVIKGVFDEFVPWFAGSDVHYGADEYPREYKDEYRTFFNDMAAHVRSLGKQPRAWGSMSVMHGNADGYDRDVIINTWNDGWYGMKSAVADGYPFINTNDGNLYVVPFADYYHGNGLNNARLYASWKPNRLDNVDTVAADAPMGAMFAVWNDLVDRDYSELDVHGLVRDSFAVIAQKTWATSDPTLSYAAFAAQMQKIGRGPGLTVIEQGGAAEAGELSFRAPVTASSTASGSDPAFLTDGRNLTRWMTTEATADFRIDLATPKQVGRLEIDWAGDAPDSYQVVTSVDGVFWQYAARDVPGDASSIDLRGVDARFVEARGIRESESGSGISAWSARVYPPNALTASATATSSGDEDAAFPASNAVDGNPATRWSASYVANPWITIDLGESTDFDTIDILWEKAAASGYTVELSQDGAQWRTVASLSGKPTPAGPSRADTVTFPSERARYAKITVTGKNLTPYLSIIDVSIPPHAGASAEIVGSTTAAPAADGVYSGAVPVKLLARGLSGDVGDIEYRVGSADWGPAPNRARSSWSARARPRSSIGPQSAIPPSRAMPRSRSTASVPRRRSP
ncbi:family 20 glycosylhydrolase [Microbacterium sp. PMB16]|uniref:family 20 glycosylhydrolase n=1 Tax=Microbacterium sp. PMB16 TaxID=3120157 RepID=UPI003F4B0879